MGMGYRWRGADEKPLSTWDWLIALAIAVALTAAIVVGGTLLGYRDHEDKPRWECYDNLAVGSHSADCPAP